MDARRKRGTIHFAPGYFTYLITMVVIPLVLLPTIGFGQLPLPENIMETVSFLFPTDGTSVGVGTGFYVRDEKTNTPYLVTAKHVLMSKPKEYFPKLCMKVNNTKGGIDLIPVDLSQLNGARIFVDKEDADIDIAVIPIRDIPMLPGRTSKDYNLAVVPVAGFATKEHFAKRAIAVGDEAFLTGWFSGFYGATQNYPIARFGRLAMATDEKIPWREDASKPAQMLNLYLVEAHTTKGNSGSPVFFRPSLQRDPKKFVIGDQPLLLAGVLKGYFHALGEQNSNSGIAAVVPAFQISQILFSEEVTRQRAIARKAVPPQKEDIEACLQAEKQVRKILGQP
jgi:hypothetical protein